jgi:dipeptidyl aminopeptidase/acylaminoacyl peptidase
MDGSSRQNFAAANDACHLVLAVFLARRPASRDGDREPRGGDIWVYDVARDTARRLTLGADDFAPIWTPDGRRVLFRSDRNQQRFRNFYWQRMDGTGDLQRLTESEFQQNASTFHPDGRVLVFVQTSGDTQTDLMILPLQGGEAEGWKPGAPSAFLKTGAREQAPSFSPDGKWLVYISDETGRPELYVRPFPGPGSAWQVSTDGAEVPAWTAKQRELIYRAPDNHLMAAKYESNGNVFTTEKPGLWSDRVVIGDFALHPDGERIAVRAAADPQTQPSEKVVVVTNVFDELQRLSPTNH